MTTEKVDPHLNEPTVYARDQHSISRKDIDADALKIMYRLIHHGYKGYLVGGAVRDLLLHKRPKDYDIATDATPRRIKSLFRNSRIIGRRFKLVHIFFHSGKIIEVSTFRDISDPIDVQEGEDGEENFLIMNDNKYGTERTDAIRRDITINALFYDLSTFSVVDYVGGVKDLNNGVIRVIGDPDLRFAEDPVRLIRVVRHAVRSSCVIEEGCYQSIIRNSKLILQSSAVRVYEELKKDLVSGYALGILQLLCKTGLLQFLLPLLSEGSTAIILDDLPFMQALARADQIIHEDRSISHSVVLALISIFTTRARLGASSPLEPFEDAVSTQEHVRLCFEKLSVPRKEREKIESMIGQLVKLTKAQASGIKASNLARRSDLDDILSLFLCMPPSEEIASLIKVLEDASDIRHRGEAQDDNLPSLGRRRRGRRRGGQRHSRKRSRRFI